MNSSEAPIRLRTLVAYSLPNAGLHFTFFLTTLYILKFSTDVLLLAPAVVGVIFGVSRAWDAVSDPLVGHLSDRTRSRLGRRRSWLLLSIVPLAIGNLMMWGPPESLRDGALAMWMAVGLFVYFTGTTVFSVPHESLGAELSEDHHERTRVFGVRSGVGLVGTLASVFVFQAITNSADPRAAVFLQAVLVISITSGLIVFAVTQTRERPEYQGRGSVSLRRSFRDVLRNPHARLLLGVFAIESFGVAVLGIVVPYAMEYVYGMKGMTGRFIAFYMIPALVLIPLWIHLSQRFGKRNLWVAGMAVQSVAFCGLFFVDAGDVLFISALGLAAGVGGGCGQVVGPSIQADVIDFDEYLTGERKEGMYFAVWNFVRKGAFGIAGIMTGLLLSAVGYEPNVEQTEAAKIGLRALFGIVPGTCYLVGTVAFLRFRLTQPEHDRIRRDLDARRP